VAQLLNFHNAAKNITKMASPVLNFITFNQDHSCLAVGESTLSHTDHKGLS
jgi:hypothetical protein